MNDRRDLIKLAGLAAAGLPLLAADQHLHGSLMDINAAQLTRKPFGDERVYFSGSTAQLKSVTTGSLVLHPGREPHPPHQHPEEEFMIVTEGHGEMFINGASHKVAPGSVLYSEANQLHGVKNTGSVPMTFYFYKWLA